MKEQEFNQCLAPKGIKYEAPKVLPRFELPLHVQWKLGGKISKPAERIKLK